MAETMMVAATSEKLADGTILESLPRHITYVSWFELPDNSQGVFFDMLEDVVVESRAPQPMGGSLLTYGDENLGYQSVRRLDRATPQYNVISDFHAQAAIYSYVRSVDPHFDSPYFGIEWNPHTSLELDEGEVFAVNSLTVFIKNRATQKKIVERALPWEPRS